MAPPQDTLRRLCELFPTFASWWEGEGAPPEDGLIDGVYYESTHHRVLAEFCDYFVENHRSFKEQQLKEFGAWIEEAILAGGEVENAVSTCFLEHVRQLRVEPLLRPYLSAQGRSRTHA